MYDLRDQGRALQLDETRENRVVERIRSSDRIGWYDEKHLAVVLPHTKGNDARKLGSDLISRLRMPHMKKNTRPTLSYSVYTFPLDDKTEYADRVPFLEHLG
jgi:PleD family two-component response regulator